MSWIKRIRTCLIFVVLPLNLLFFFRNIDEREYGSKIPPRHLKDMPNPKTDFIECGQASNKSTFMCDPDLRLSTDFKLELDQFGALTDQRIFLTLIGNFDNHLVDLINFEPKPPKISPDIFAKALLETWKAADNSSSPKALIFVRVNSNDNSAMFSIQIDGNSEYNCYAIVKDMYYLYGQRFQWFRPKSKERNQKMLQEAIKSAFEEIDMYFRNGITQIDSPYKYMYTDQERTSNKVWWHAYIGSKNELRRDAQYSFWLSFVKFSVLVNLEITTFIGSPILAIMIFVLATIRIVQDCTRDRTETETNERLWNLFMELAYRKQLRNFYRTIFKSDHCSICYEIFRPGDLEKYLRVEEPELGPPLTCFEKFKHGITACCCANEPKPEQLPDNVKVCESPVVVSCGHVFGYECLRAFIIESGEEECPLCREPLLHNGNRNPDTNIATEIVHVQINIEHEQV